jgi:hypothetical protein
VAYSKYHSGTYFPEGTKEHHDKPESGESVFRPRRKVFQTDVVDIVTCTWEESLCRGRC